MLCSGGYGLWLQRCFGGVWTNGAVAGWVAETGNQRSREDRKRGGKYYRKASRDKWSEKGRRAVCALRPFFVRNSSSSFPNETHLRLGTKHMPKHRRFSSAFNNFKLREGMLSAEAAAAG